MAFCCCILLTSNSNRGIISFSVAPLINAVDVSDGISLSGAPHAYFGAP